MGRDEAHTECQETLADLRDVYIPRPATEIALRKLRDWAALGEPALALIGPPGIGKSLVLRLFALEASAAYHVVQLDGAPTESREICRTALATLELSTSVDPEGDLLDLARASLGERNGVIIVLDHAQGLTPKAARRLSILMGRSNGALRLAIAAVPRELAPGLLTSLGDDLIRVELNEPMSRNEVETHLRSRFGDPGDEMPFSRSDVTRLHDTSGGIPALLDTQTVRLLQSRLPDVAPPKRGRRAKARPEATHPQAVAKSAPAKPQAAAPRPPSPAASMPRRDPFQGLVDSGSGAIASLGTSIIAFAGGVAKALDPRVPVAWTWGGICRVGSTLARGVRGVGSGVVSCFRAIGSGVVWCFHTTGSGVAFGFRCVGSGVRFCFSSAVYVISAPLRVVPWAWALTVRILAKTVAFPGRVAAFLFSPIRGLLERFRGRSRATEQGTTQEPRIEAARPHVEPVAPVEPVEESREAEPATPPPPPRRRRSQRKPATGPAGRRGSYFDTPREERAPRISPARRHEFRYPVSSRS